MHRGDSDLSHLVRNGYKLPAGIKYYDTHTAARMIWSEQEDSSLEHLALRMTNMGVWRPNFKKLDSLDFDVMSDEYLVKRCGNDAEASIRLKQITEPELTRLGLARIWSLMMDVLPILATAGGTGMALNRDELRRRAIELGGDPLFDPKVGRTSGDPGWIEHEGGSLQATFGIQNIRSDQQVASSLYSTLGATPLEENSRGYSVGKRSLLWARHQARQSRNQSLEVLLTRLLDFNVKDKLLSTYYNPWLMSGGLRVYSTYNLGEAQTGRLSSSNTNLQNVPPIARELVVPSEGFDWILSVDAVQLELYIAAHVSQDPVLLDYVRRGMDLHSITASRVIGVKQPQTKEEFRAFKEKYPKPRHVGKTANFATIFLVSAESLFWQVFEGTQGEVVLSGMDEAQAYIDSFFSLFTGYKDYVESLRCLDKIRSDTGRIWWLPQNQAGLRKKANYRIQSLASDVILTILRVVNGILRKHGYKTRIIGEVHDSIVFECPDKELKQVAKINKWCFDHVNDELRRQFGFKLTVPIRAEQSYGRNWKDMKVFEV